MGRSEPEQPMSGESLFSVLCRSTAPRSVVLIRLLGGWVFLEEGIQKFLFPAVMGAGRFARIGIPWPATMGPFVGAVEVICGAMLLMGLLTRLAAIPLLIDISVAIVSTKIPILLQHNLGPFHLAQLNRYGFWSMASEARTDFSMLLGLLFLLIAGAGPWSLDARLARQP
jgi:putative oxidoreductase